MPLRSTIRFKFMSKNPHKLNNINTKKSGHQIPHLIFRKSMIFIIYGHFLIRVTKCNYWVLTKGDFKVVVCNA